MISFGKWVPNRFREFLMLCLHTSPEICLLIENVNVVVNATNYKHGKKDGKRQGCKGMMVKIIKEIEMDKNAEVVCKGAKQKVVNTYTKQNVNDRD